MSQDGFSKFIFSRTATRLFWLSLVAAIFLLLKFIVPSLDFHTHDRGVGVAYPTYLSPFLSAFSVCTLIAAGIVVCRVVIAFVIPWWRRSNGA